MYKAYHDTRFNNSVHIIINPFRGLAYGVIGTLFDLKNIRQFADMITDFDLKDESNKSWTFIPFNDSNFGAMLYYESMENLMADIDNIIHYTC